MTLEEILEIKLKLAELKYKALVYRNAWCAAIDFTTSIRDLEIAPEGLDDAVSAAGELFFEAMQEIGAERMKLKKLINDNSETEHFFVEQP